MSEEDAFASLYFASTRVVRDSDRPRIILFMKWFQRSSMDSRISQVKGIEFQC